MREIKNKSIVLLLTLLLVSSATVMVFAGTGGIRIDPELPIGLDSPAEFGIWAHTGDTYDPHVFLVMPASCMDGLIGDVTVSWDGGSTGAITEWNLETGGGKVPGDTTPGAGYTVASLKSHLETTEDIYWAFVPILGEETMVQGQHYTITVKMASGAPSMLVYIIGKETVDAACYNMRIPPTIPGFVVPEIPIGTLATLATMIGTVGLLRRNRL